MDDQKPKQTADELIAELEDLQAQGDEIRAKIKVTMAKLRDVTDEAAARNAQAADNQQR